MPKDKPQKSAPLSEQFQQIQQQAQQRALEETAPLHTMTKPNNIELQDNHLLQPYLAPPTPEIPHFKQVPLFDSDSFDNNIDKDIFVQQNQEHLIDQYNKSLAIVPANVLNTLAYHQLQGATQSQFIISLSPEIVQLLDSNIPHQLSILYNTNNIESSSLAQLYHMLTALFQII